MNYLSTRLSLVFALIVGLGVAGPVFAHCKNQHQPPHPHCNNGGGDETFDIDVTVDGFTIFEMSGVLQSPNVIDGAATSSLDLTNLLDGGDLALDGVGADNIANEYNTYCLHSSIYSGGQGNGGNTEPLSEGVTPIADLATSISLNLGGEEGNWVLVIGINLGDESYTLLLQGPGGVLPPPTMVEDIPVTLWNNRGGGNGRQRRCNVGTHPLYPVSMGGPAVRLLVTNTTN